MYDPLSNSWMVLNCRMHRGLEGGVMVPYRFNEVLLFGGTQRKGRVDTVYVLNFQDFTVHYRSSMKFKRSMQGGYLFGDTVY